MTPSEQITDYIASLADWRGNMLTDLRKLILGADPGLVEEWKWNTPVFSKNGNVVATGVFQDHVKLNFFKGASLTDTKGLFNAGLEAKTSRGIDFHEGDSFDAPALKELITAAAALNAGGKTMK